jgi:hypothetical protein
MIAPIVAASSMDRSVGCEPTCIGAISLGYGVEP